MFFLDKINAKTKFVTFVTKWVHLVIFTCTIVPEKTVFVIKAKQVADQSSYVYFQVGTVDPVGDFRTLISQRDEDRFDEGMLVSPVSQNWQTFPEVGHLTLAKHQLEVCRDQILQKKVKCWNQ